MARKYTTNDNKEIFLEDSKASELDQDGTFGPYVLVMVDGKEADGFRVIGRDDGFALRSEFRKCLTRNLSANQVLDRLVNKYLNLR